MIVQRIWILHSVVVSLSLSISLCLSFSLSLCISFFLFNQFFARLFFLFLSYSLSPSINIIEFEKDTSNNSHILQDYRTPINLCERLPGKKEEYQYEPFFRIPYAKTWHVGAFLFPLNVHKSRAAQCESEEKFRPPAAGVWEIGEKCGLAGLGFWGRKSVGGRFFGLLYCIFLYVFVEFEEGILSYVMYENAFQT